MKYVIWGFGARGKLYSLLLRNEHGIAPAAVCDMRADRLNTAREWHGVPENRLFASDKEFLAAGRLGDLCIISTQDDMHAEHAVRAMEAGYDLLLEKPIATSLEACGVILSKATQLNRKVFVCHVLRYAPFFGTLKKELDTGAYGKIMALNLTENIAYWHFAHSYVRGAWSQVPPSAPMVIAKTCHDLDIICWLVQSEARAVSSMGSLGYYTAANAPEGSAARCLDCAVRDNCPYDAGRYYITEGFEKGVTGWPVDVVCEAPTTEGLRSALRSGPYGRCVYRCGNNAVDRQVTNIEFENGVTAHLTAAAFSRDCYRKIHIYCERGEIYGDMAENVLTANLFGGESKRIDINELSAKGDAHGGGDARLIRDIAAVYSGGKAESLTTLAASVVSHTIGFAAEQSRQNGGERTVPVRLNGERTQKNT